MTATSWIEFVLFLSLVRTSQAGENFDRHHYLTRSQHSKKVEGLTGKIYTSASILMALKEINQMECLIDCFLAIIGFFEYGI